MVAWIPFKANLSNYNTQMPHGLVSKENNMVN